LLVELEELEHLAFKDPESRGYLKHTERKTFPAGDRWHDLF
jgi:hypothetical protein